MKKLIALGLTLTLIGATSVQAQKPKKERERENEQGEDRREHKRDDDEHRDREKSAFNGNQREAARDYFAADHGRGKCPPGLAKKHNGCLPPGQAKKRYAVGRPLGQGIVYQQLPGDLSVRIGPAPTGYLYGLLDGDLIKMNATTRLIVDAIGAFVR
jgi:Ni/Co efflux regulator RcnB